MIGIYWHIQVYYTRMLPEKRLKGNHSQAYSISKNLKQSMHWVQCIVTVPPGFELSLFNNISTPSIYIWLDDHAILAGARNLHFDY